MSCYLSLVLILLLLFLITLLTDADLGCYLDITAIPIVVTTNITSIYFAVVAFSLLETK